MLPGGPISFGGALDFRISTVVNAKNVCASTLWLRDGMFGAGTGGLVRVPKRIGEASEAVNGPCLRDKEEDGDFNDDEFARLRNDAERNDERGGPCGRVAHPEEHHDGPGCGKRKSSGEDSGPEDCVMYAKGLGAGSRKDEGSIAA